MKLTRKFWLSSSILALFSPSAMISAETWVPRDIEDVLEDIQIDQNNQKTYTVQSGDTLGIIAKAMDLPVRHLANINGIENVDLIFPGNEITAQLNNNDEAVSLTVDTPQGESVEVDLPVNISPIEATEDIEATETTSTPVEIKETVDQASEETAVEAVTEAVTEAPVTLEEVTEESISHVEAEETEYVADTEATTMLQRSLASVTETVIPSTSIEETMEAPVETTATPVVEATTEAPIETTVTTTQAPVVETTTATPVETTVATTQAPVVETTTATPVETTVATTQAPVVETTTATPVETTAATTQAPQVESRPANGLQPQVAAFRDQVTSKYGVPVVSEVRPGDPGDHGKGKAVDFGITPGDALGDQVAQYALDQMGNYGISYVIWEQKINGYWTGGQWETMEDRGNITANHYDHVHVSFY